MFPRLQAGDVGLAHPQLAGEFRLSELVLHAIGNHPRSNLMGEASPLPLRPILGIVEITTVPIVCSHEIRHLHSLSSSMRCVADAIKRPSPRGLTCASGSTPEYTTLGIAVATIECRDWHQATLFACSRGRSAPKQPLEVVRGCGAPLGVAT